MSASALYREAYRLARSSGRTLLLAFLVGGLAGGIDLALSLLERPSGFTSLPALYPPLIATTLTFALLYAILWGLFLRPVVDRTSAYREPAEIALGTFLVTSFLAASAAGLVRFPGEPKEWFELGIAVLFSGLVSSLAYFAWIELSRSPDRRDAAGIAGLAAPFLLFELLLLEWGQLYHVESVFSPTSLVAVCLLGVALVLTVRFIRRRRRKALVALAFAFLGLALGNLGYRRLTMAMHDRSPGADHDVRHVILISADTLRADALSGYDDLSPSSPSLDRLASEGVLFERAYASAPWTLASLASTLTGLSPTVHTLTEVKSRLPDEVSTLGEYLGRSGYHTAAIVLNDLLHPRANLAQGFDDYLFLTEPSFGASFGARLLQSVIPSQFPSPPWPRSEHITASALDWLEAHRDRDFFLWIHYYDPHAPYTPPGRYLPEVEPPSGMGMDFYGQKEVTAGFGIPSRAQRQWIEALYRAEVRYLDDSVGALLDGLKRLDLYDDSLIVFTSDHGEEFWDHGAHGHGHTLYNELLSVPLIVKTPDFPGPGRRVDVRVPTEALTPTILDLCGIDYEPERLSSKSFAPLVRAEPPQYEPSPIVSTSPVLFDRQESVIFGDLKYVRSTIGDREVLFDLERDPDEREPLSSSAMPDCELARGLLEKHHEVSSRLRKHFGVAVKEEAVFDEDTLRKLRGLGYVQ